ncbi:hypothetical protein HAX54_004511 [Datura stramonium]|uniref:Uncharacterized protein n=1 Tax=Datura stramonium TaxID=4076 RepID=A0ABS8RTW5_DATST|nr:hypothetical protein [Datura stramonium]
MIEELDIVFNYGSNWVISMKLVYNKKILYTCVSDNGLSDVEVDSHCDIEMLQCYNHEEMTVVTDRLEKFKKLVLGMTFGTIQEARQLESTVEKYFKLNVSRDKLKRAKIMALDKLEDSFKDDYNRLEAYGQELRQTNSGTDVGLLDAVANFLPEARHRFCVRHIEVN